MINRTPEIEEVSAPKRRFHLSEILSVVTDRLFTPDVYKLLVYMVGEEVSWPELSEVKARCRPELLGQYPQLATVAVSKISNWRSWFDELMFDFVEFPYARTQMWKYTKQYIFIRRQIAKFGEFLVVVPVASPKGKI